MTHSAEDLAAPYTRLPVDGVAITVLTSSLGAETIAASNGFAARLDELQLDLGEGPIWQAVHERHPVLRPDLADARGDEWPTALTALLAAGAGAVYAFPMSVGALAVGTVGLYAAVGSTLTSADAPDIEDLAARTARTVLDRVLLRAVVERPGEWTSGPWSRREVHQAAGMVAAQAGTTPDEAMLLIRAAAFASGQSVLQVSAQVLERAIDLGRASGTDTPGRNRP
ncbi:MULTISPECIES: ANTAR domain-containing protein [Curtobacterium]|uniref:ANTAR domain-containing protein n=1 Tax=Curtobacterium TaxID=2034 RepID=UPI0007DEA25B|nr:MULTISPECIES: ANTAR domain-containing protein [Curtobacterium]KTR25160.1 hypothetical protein NS330_00825 [Curtobacterium citreum]